NELVIPASQAQRSSFTEIPLHLKRLCQDCTAAVSLVAQRFLHVSSDRARHASGIATQIWKCNAPMIGSKATTLVAIVTETWSLGCNRAEALGILLANWLRSTAALLSTWAEDIRPQNAGSSGHGWTIIYGTALSVIVLTIGGGVTFLSRQNPETAARAST